MNRPDGAHAFWDNKSKEKPVNLKERIRQFHHYMEQADKPVPIFVVIGPDFTQDSQAEALHYHAQRFDRDVVLITAKELKDLA